VAFRLPSPQTPLRSINPKKQFLNANRTMAWKFVIVSVAPADRVRFAASYDVYGFL